ncbi:hypothetical protein PGTUg99_029715 [Puccinia graminis f. sp. tritici]|uniref:Uncharacterized protein n=1 Tax=Puccinia graminis f. sp. tritici TaxID=56615 RepID=A0A5B0MDE6_PUCGR|nr:hypothetical protein PGTUg99_029715 [Puccinia graminis f. sp. tritici]
MFLLPCCLGRSRKLETSKVEQPADNDISSCSDSEVVSATKEIEPKLPQGAPTPRRTRTTDSNKSGMRSRSSILSWCSVTSVINFCTLKSSEPSPSMQASPSTIPCTSPILAANPRTKLNDISSILSLIIQEEGEDQLPNRRQSYSDDPFAPPTPRATRFGSFSNCSLADHTTLRSSVQSTPAEANNLNTSNIEDRTLTLPESVCLPNIDRLSKFDFNEWNPKWIKNSPVIQPIPVGHLSMSTIRMSPSPTLTYRPQQFARRGSRTPTLSSHTNYSSRTEDSNQIPPPQV